MATSGPLRPDANLEFLYCKDPACPHCKELRDLVKEMKKPGVAPSPRIQPKGNASSD